MTVLTTFDEIDNRNLATLARAYDEAPPELQAVTTHPRHYDCGTREIVLRAMRRAGDEAMLDQVTVRLERTLGSTHDVRANARLVAE